MGKKCPLKAVALAARIKWLNKWKCRESLCDGLDWKYKMGCKNPGDSPRKGEGWRRKAMRRTTTKWRTSAKWRSKMRIQQQNEEQQYHKYLTGGSPRQSTIAGSFWLFKKMIAELLLVLPLYLALFFIWYQFRHLIKIMADVENILNDVVDTPKEATEQNKKTRRIKECLRQGQVAFIRV